MFRSISRCVATAATLAILGAAPAVASPDIDPAPATPSGAAWVPVGQVPAWSVPGSASIVARSSSTAATASTIVCTPNVQNPHESSHVPGTVNVVGTVTCTSAVPEIQLQVALYRQNPADGRWYLQSASGVMTYSNTAFGQANAAAPCEDGNWVGWMSWYFKAPPGYTPPGGGNSGFGNQVAITCST
jgi:hypothetical protein